MSQPIALPVVAAQIDEKYRAHCVRLTTDEPWVGRVEIEREGGKVAEYFIGHRHLADERIVGLGHPIAKVYFEQAVGEPIEVEQSFFKKIEGTFVGRSAVVRARDRGIVELELRDAQGPTVLVAAEAGFVPRDEAPARPVARGGLDDVMGQLTREQYRLITAERDRPLIIQGRAGSGKTSVALYRLKVLTSTDPEVNAVPVDPARVLVVMFNKSLSRFVRRSLERDSLQGVKLDTFAGWALEAVKRAYVGKLEVTTKNLPEHHATATELKRQVGVLRATEAYVKRQSANLEVWLAEKLSPYDPKGLWVQRLAVLDGAPVQRLAKLRAEVARARDAAKTQRERKLLEQVDTTLKYGKDKFTLYKEDLRRLLTDRALLAEHLPTTKAADLDKLVAFQRELQTVPQTGKVGPHVTFADLAILLRLMQLKCGGLPDKKRDDEAMVYDHLVIDEVQDFGAVDLTVLLSSVRTRAGVTIVGDLNQKILPEVDFMGWEQLAAELGVAGAQVARLEAPHRSTEAIMRFADSLVGDPSTPGRAGRRPTMVVVDGDRLVTQVAELAADVLRENAMAHVCVVGPRATGMKDLFDRLEKVPALEGKVRMGGNDEFSFEPGVTVTNRQQVKGLEFDAVIVLDPTDRNYPANDQGRKALYTAATRARDVLHFVGASQPGQLLADAIDAGLVELDDQTDVVPVSFEGDDGDIPF